MAGGKLSPRQKMINMMYLVLTALLALNVSKEVLNSFFEVNLSIIETTDALEEKNTETYSDFDNVQNKKKVEEYKRLGKKSDVLQSMICTLETLIESEEGLNNKKHIELLGLLYNYL